MAAYFFKGGLFFYLEATMTYEIVSVRKRKTVKIKHPSDVYGLVKSFTKKKQEHFIVLTLNGSYDVISMRIVSIGLVNKTIIHPREIFIHAIKDNAIAIIVCHNHPSNNLEPSDEDIEVTEILEKAGKIIGINLLDHVIVSKSGYYSFKQNDKM
jgi:DNA repair protein RadC